MSDWMFLSMLLLIYFIPSMVALIRAKRNTIAIIALNLLLGWTFIGWVIALVWALMKDPIKERTR